MMLKRAWHRMDWQALMRGRERATPLQHRTISQLTQAAHDVMVIVDGAMKRGLLMKPRPAETYRGHRRNLGKRRYRSQRVE